MISDATFRTLSVLLGIGTFLIRISFRGFFGCRNLPDRALLHLKHVEVAVFPALFMPPLMWPAATGGVFDAVCFTAAVAALAAGSGSAPSSAGAGSQAAISSWPIETTSSWFRSTRSTA